MTNVYEPLWRLPVVGAFRRRWRCLRPGCGREVVSKYAHDKWHGETP